MSAVWQLPLLLFSCVDMAVSDDKQNRLSTLSQDVIAVPKKPAASPAPRQPDSPRTPERKAVPPSQDVFRSMPFEQDVFAAPPVQTPPPAPRPQPAQPQPPSPSVAVSVPAQARVRPQPAASQGPTVSPMAMVTAAVAVVALLVAIYGATRSNDTGGADALAVEKLTQELLAANERVAKLEQALSAASTSAQAATTPGQGNVLQISAGMRELRDDVDGVANELAKLATQIAEVRTLAGSGVGQSKLAASQVEQLASRVATLNEQVANAPRGGGNAAAAPVSAETQAQIKALTARTEKMGNDIRQLYRLVGGQ